MSKVGDMSQKEWMKKLQEINPDISESDAKELKERHKNRDVDVAIERVTNRIKPFAPASEAVTMKGYYLSSVDQKDKKTRELNGTISLFVMEDEEGKKYLSKVVLYGSELPFKLFQKYELEGRAFGWAINATRGVKSVEGKIKREEVLELLKKMAIPVRDIKQGDSGVICVAMSSDLKKVPSEFKESGGEDDTKYEVTSSYPFFTPMPKKIPEDLKKMPSTGIAMDVSSKDVDDEWVNIRFVPQAFGMISLAGIIDEADLDDLAQCKKDEDQEALLKEIVPSRDHPTYVFGFMKKVKERGDRTYRTFRGTFAIRDLKENFAEASSKVSQNKKAAVPTPLLEENGGTEEPIPDGKDEDSPEEVLAQLTDSDAEAEVKKWLAYNPKATLASIIRATKGKLEGYDQKKLEEIYTKLKEAKK